MKQIEISTGKATLLAVELPEGATDLAISHKGFIEYKMIRMVKGEVIIKLTTFDIPLGFQHIGTLDQMTEEVWRGVVDEVEPFESGAYLNYYRQKEWDRNFYPTALRSGFSLFKANGLYFDNPTEKYFVNKLTGEQEVRIDWKQWEEKLFNPERTHFFIKQD